MSFVASLSIRAAVAGTVIILGMTYAHRRWIRPLETRHAEAVDTSTSHVGFRCVVRKGNEP